jgi:ABC-2 type transport system ATP-binding protein
MIDLLKQLKQETFVLSLEDNLKKDSNLNEFSYTLIGGNQLEVLVDEDHSINDLFELLNREKIKVLSLRNKSNRLEELFMRLVHSKNDISKENS